MDQRNEFTKWIKTVEEALSGQTREKGAPLQEAGCECGEWDCPTCFPDTDGSSAGSAGGKKKVKLGDIVQTTEFKKTGSSYNGSNSPLSNGGDLEEAPDDGFEMEDDYGLDDGFGDEGIAGNEPVANNIRGDSGAAQGDGNEYDFISSIKYMQDMGLSKSQYVYSPDDLAAMSSEELDKVHNEVMGGVDEATGPAPKPVQTKSSELDDLDGIDDLLNPAAAQPIAAYEPDDGEYDDTLPDPEQSMSLPRASADSTRRATQNINPSDQMRDFMNRINPMAGGDEPELAEPEVAQDQLVVRTASDVPAVISSAIRASGMQNPEWHNVNNLPGFNDRNIRGMGRQVFSMFTSTPLEQIQTIANVQGQGPNTDAEMRAVAGWLRDNAQDLGEVELSHGMAIPGYQPDVKEYSANGIRFHVVRDPMGQYIYAYPDKDAKQNTGQGRIGQKRGQLAGGRPQPRLRESMREMGIFPTLFEQIKWDEEVEEVLLNESTLSRLIGKQKGGQRLVQWLHRKHELGNDAELTPASFDERLMWKQFKSHPDDFVIVSARNGVAGIKPSAGYIKHMQERYAKKGKTYSPANDPHLKYQIVAFTDDGQQVDTALLQQRPDPNAPEPSDTAYVTDDPTVIKARMGKHNGRDTQNADNVFNLLAEQIGDLITVYISGFENVKDGPAPTGSAERTKLAHRTVNDRFKKDYAADDEYKRHVKQRRSGVIPPDHAPAVVPSRMDPSKIKKPRISQNKTGFDKLRFSKPTDDEQMDESGNQTDFAPDVAAKSPPKLSRDAAKYDNMPVPVKQDTTMSNSAALNKVFKRVRPVLKTLANQALAKINNTMRRAIEGGNFENVQKFAKAGENLQNFLARLDTNADINISPPAYEYGNEGNFSLQIQRAVAEASGAEVGSKEYTDYLNRAAAGSALELRPILDSLRSNLTRLR